MLIKVSTLEETADKHVICVYTKDFCDKQEVNIS